jgi:hypothetical protein
MTIQNQADQTSEMIRSQMQGFEGKLAPAVEPFKPLPTGR